MTQACSFSLNTYEKAAEKFLARQKGNNQDPWNMQGTINFTYSSQMNFGISFLMFF